MSNPLPSTGNGWISTKDEIPSKDEPMPVIVHFHAKGAEPQVRVFYRCDPHVVGSFNVMHWMRLPEPPA